MNTYQKIKNFAGLPHVENSCTIKPTYGKNIGKLEINFDKPQSKAFTSLLAITGNPFKRKDLNRIQRQLKDESFQMID